jgi:enoyl-CoA hydratase/carnithine racemase
MGDGPITLGLTEDRELTHQLAAMLDSHHWWRGPRDEVGAEYSDAMVRGGGLGITTATVTGTAVRALCDLALDAERIAATPAFTPFNVSSRSESPPDLGASWPPPMPVASQRTKPIATRAQTMHVELARIINQATGVALDDEIDAFLATTAARLLAGAPIALAHTKARLNNGAGSTMCDGLRSELPVQRVNVPATTLLKPT